MVAFELSLEVEHGFTRKFVFGKENGESKGLGHDIAGDLSQ